MSWHHSFNELLDVKYKRVILTEEHARSWMLKQYKKLCKVKNISTHMWLEITEHNFPYCQFFSDGVFELNFDGLSGKEFKEKYTFELFFDMMSADFIETPVSIGGKWRPIEKLTYSEEEENKLIEYLYELAFKNRNSKFDYPSVRISLEPKVEPGTVWRDERDNVWIITGIKNKAITLFHSMSTDSGTHTVEYMHNFMDKYTPIQSTELNKHEKLKQLRLKGIINE